jgi:hypothetical protein
VSRSDIIGGSYEERISTMADTGIAIDALDKTEKEVASYDELAPLGSAAHPLSNSSAEYLEILTFEQPSQYGDAYLFRAERRPSPWILVTHPIINILTRRVIIRVKEYL